MDYKQLFHTATELLETLLKQHGVDTSDNQAVIKWIEESLSHGFDQTNHKPVVDDIVKQSTIGEWLDYIESELESGNLDNLNVPPGNDETLM